MEQVQGKITFSFTCTCAMLKIGTKKRKDYIAISLREQAQGVQRNLSGEALNGYDDLHVARAFKEYFSLTSE